MGKAQGRSQIAMHAKAAVFCETIADLKQKLVAEADISQPRAAQLRTRNMPAAERVKELCGVRTKEEKSAFPERP